jgi:hypothetical protein
VGGITRCALSSSTCLIIGAGGHEPIGIATWCLEACISFPNHPSWFVRSSRYWCVCQCYVSTLRRHLRRKCDGVSCQQQFLGGTTNKRDSFTYGFRLSTSLRGLSRCQRATERLGSSFAIVAAHLGLVTARLQLRTTKALRLIYGRNTNDERRRRRRRTSAGTGRAWCWRARQRS